MRRMFAMTVLAALVFALIVLHSAIKDFLWTHPWWHILLVAVPTIALPILAYFESRHFREANGLRIEAIVLQRRIANLTAELDAERKKHLQQETSGIVP